MKAYISIDNGYCLFSIPSLLDLKFKVSDSLKNFIRVVDYNKVCGLVTAICNYKFNENTWEDEEYFDIKSILYNLRLDSSILINIEEVIIYESKES